jgi:hypothetical protein
LLSEVVQRRHCSVAELLDELVAAPKPGSALPKKGLDDVTAGCRSTAECDLRDVIRRARALPEPRWNQPLPGYPSLFPDACWPEARLVVEVDSVEWHQFGDAPEKTARATRCTQQWARACSRCRRIGYGTIQRRCDTNWSLRTGQGSPMHDRRTALAPGAATTVRGSRTK